MTIFTVDVDYRETHAIAAGVMFANWEDSIPINQFVTQVDNIAEYEPGHFYKRELPCLLKLLNQLDTSPQYIIVDGYVHLEETKKPGLGKYLYDALQGESIVIGVAKTRFSGAPAEIEVFKGESQRPLYVTAAGISDAEAKKMIQRMDGRYRIPTMLKLVDQLSKQTESMFF
jgi:deoxyribonuclease V